MRTAKRVSESLGTATEMRAMKNYAGHRLSPWLGHLMVSRSETARALKTQGEIMQLPENEEIVMVSGLQPIKAKKARYYEDQHLNNRLMPPPDVVNTGAQKLPKDDWSGTPVIQPVPVKPVKPHHINDHSNGGVRQEPDLSPHEDIAFEPAEPAREFIFADESVEDADAVNTKRLNERVQTAARQVALDPNDGIDM